MPTYEVERRTLFREIYVVEADSEESAAENWVDGKLEISEALESELESVTLAD